MRRGHEVDSMLNIDAILYVVETICGPSVPPSLLERANARVELQNCFDNGHVVTGYQSNFVSSNDLFTPPAAGTIY